MSGNVDLNAVSRTLSYLKKQIADLESEIALAENGEYSPLMSFDRFQEIRAAAKAEYSDFSCLIGDGPHICSQCDALVRAYMDSRKKVA